MGIRPSRLIILGGGPAGLATAFYACRRRIPSLVFEKGAEFGGLCRTARFGEHRYDTGAHRFHDRDPQITADVRELLNGKLRRVATPSRIYRWGRFIGFPPTPIALLAALPPSRIVAIAWELLGLRVRRGKTDSFEDFALNRFGKTLARALLIDYSEKLWGLPASRLSPQIATRRLNGLSIHSLLLELFFKARVTAHIDGHFLYPLEGYGAIADALQAAVPSESLRAGCGVTRVEREGARIRRIRHEGGIERVVDSDLVVSTLPLSLLIGLLHPGVGERAAKAARKIRFRHVRLLYLRLDQPKFSEHATIYLPDPDLSITRITEPKIRSPRMCPPHETGIAAEVPCSSGDALSRLEDEELFRKVRDELSEQGLLKPDRILAWQHRFLPNAYPVMDLEFSENREIVFNELRSLSNLRMLGRQGLFHYSHLHHQMRMGRDLIDRLSGAGDKATSEKNGVETGHGSP